MPDKFFVGTFWADAQSIFETAAEAGSAGSPDCDVAILIGSHGEIHMLDAAGWASLPGLLAQHGARTGYRVVRANGRVRLEGRSAFRTCLLESESPAKAARRLLAHTAPPRGWPEPASGCAALGLRLLAGSPPQSACPPVVAP